MIHDAVGGSEDNVTELTGGEEVLNPGLNVVDGDIEAGRDDTALVDTTIEVDDDLASALVVDNFEFVNVA